MLSYRYGEKMENIDFREEILTGIKNGTDLWEVANKYKNMGIDKKTMFDNLELLRREMREKDDELSEDCIMDVMDCVVGWCGNPAHRLFPDSNDRLGY